MIDSILTRLDNIESQTPLRASGSDNLIDYVPMEQDHEQSQSQRSSREGIPRRCFEIEGEAFMIAHDEEEPKTIHQALSVPNAKNWFQDMEEEMNSMKSNESGIWLIYHQVGGLLGTSGFSILSIRHMGQLTKIRLG